MKNRNPTAKSPLFSAIAMMASIAMQGTVNAAVVSGTVTSSTCVPACTFELIAPPSQVGNDNQDTQRLFAFDEQQDVLLTGDLILDDTTIGTGTRISSHYVFLDPASTTVQRNVVGSVTFDALILGVASTTGAMLGSDYLGSPTTTYNSPELRGLETTEDSYSFSGNTLNVDLWASTPGDYIRVITVSAVPIPAAAWLFGSGLLGLIGVARVAT
jgi:hypothetical protein